jgi:PAS domain S-box-containing protein
LRRCTEDIQSEARVEIEYIGDRLTSTIEQRLKFPVYGLNGARALFSHDSKITRDEFRAYVESTDLPTEFSGVRGFSFNQRVLRSGLDAFVAKARADGAPGFTLRQLEDKAQPDLYIVKFIEPVASNAGALGLDIGSNPLRRRALQQAIDSGAPAMSEPISLVQNQVATHGALLMVPVFARGTRASTPTERRAAVQGLMVAPIVFEDVLAGLPEVADGLVGVELVDTTAGDSAGTLIYDSAKHGKTFDERDPATQNPRYSARKTLSTMGRELTVLVKGNSRFNAARDHQSPWIVVIVGLLFSALLWLYLRRRWQQHDLVLGMVDQRTRELERERLRLKTILETATDGIYILDASGLLVEANPAMLRLLGRDVSAIGQLRVTEWDTLIESNTIQQTIATLIQNQSSSIFESQNKCGDGRVVDVEVSARGITIEGKGLVYCTSRDITESKRAANQIKEAEALLRTSFDTVDEAFVVFDAEDRLVYCNNKYRDIYVGIAHLMVPGVSFESLIRAAAQQGTYMDAIGRVEEWVAERLASHRKGNIKLIQHLSSGRVLNTIERHTPGGHIVGFRVDVTELYRAKEAAEAANIAKSQFLASMSHEIRTPMNGILGMAQVLRNPNLSDAERIDFADTIYKSGQTLMTLLNDILDLSKVEAGKVELETIAIAPMQILQEVQTLFNETAQAKGMQITIDWRGSARHYLGDPTRLRQMLSNLVSNALKFTDRGSIGVEGREVACTAQSAILEFAVSDTGIGIAVEKQGLLFQSFSQADSSITRQFGGTGLGLSLVRNLARLMGGDAGFESTQGVGSRFWFRVELVCVDGSSLSLQPIARGGFSDPVQQPQLSARVLVVEDNPINQKVMRLFLEQLGVTALFADDGQQGSDMVKSDGSVDLVLMDLEMPVLDGYAATQQIRQWAASTGQVRCPIIGLTAKAFADDIQRCFEAGMDEVLTKPIELSRLTEVLCRWLPQAVFEFTPGGAAEVPRKVLDVASVRGLLEELIPLLKDHQFKSVARFKAVQLAVAGTPLAPQFVPVASALMEFRFDVALVEVQQLLQMPTLAVALSSSQEPG